MSKAAVSVKVYSFNHCYAGTHAPQMPNTPLPGDGLFADVEVDGARLALCAIAQRPYDYKLKPYVFEAAIKAFLAALANHLGEDPPPDIETVLMGRFGPGIQ